MSLYKAHGELRVAMSCAFDLMHFVPDLFTCILCMFMTNHTNILTYLVLYVCTYVSDFLSYFCEFLNEFVICMSFRVAFREGGLNRSDRSWFGSPRSCYKVYRVIQNFGGIKFWRINSQVLADNILVNAPN